MDHEDKQIPYMLLHHRLLMGYSQDDAAQVIGLESGTRISEWETGAAKPNIDNMFKLALAYHTIGDQLFIHLRELYRPEIERREKALQKQKEKRHRDMGG